MKCELCGTNDSGARRICQDCIEMVGRLALVNQRMHCREECEADRLAAPASRRTGAGRG